MSRTIANRAPHGSGGIVLGHGLNEKGTIEAETTVVRTGDCRTRTLRAPQLSGRRYCRRARSTASSSFASCLLDSV